MTSSASRSLPDVPDILHHVFSYLDPVHHLRHEHDQMYESRRSLALAARTCRAFTAPALDILWKRLPDDQPLADLLCELRIAAKDEGPSDPEPVGKNKPDCYRLPNQHRSGRIDQEANKMFARQWRLSRGYDIRYYLRVTGDPRHHPGWPSFLEFASRVRAITLYAFDGPGWYGIWEELRSRADGAPILPNLLSVAFCHISSQALTPGLFALISPSVRKLNFNLGDYSWHPSNENLRSFLSQCFISAPKIDHLRLKVSLSRLSPPLLQVHCSRLRHLEVVPLLDPDSLRLLVELPALQYLSISLSREDFPASSAPLTFRSVSTLVVEGTWTSLAMFLATIHLPSMHALSITGWEFGEPAAQLAKAATHVFHTLATKHPSILTLSVFATQHGRQTPSIGCLTYGVFPVTDTVAVSLLDLVRPLLALSGLRHLSLTFPSYFDIVCTETDLRAVAEAFPALDAFHLHVSHYDARRVNPFYSHPKELALVTPERPRGGPLAALTHFAWGCPRLRMLHLPAMELAAPAEDEPLSGVVAAKHAFGTTREPHGLRTLVIPKILLPPGRADLVGRVSEVVGAAFPSSATTFGAERLAVEGDWAVMVDGAASGCLDCVRGPKITFA